MRINVAGKRWVQSYLFLNLNAKLLHEHVLVFGKKTTIWRDKGISRIKFVQMNNIKSLSKRKIDRIPDVQVMELRKG